MKKLLSTFTLALLTAASTWAYDFKAGDLYYNITDKAAKTVEVTYEYRNSSNYSSLPTTVTIPETASYNGTTYSVTSIGDYAFSECSALTQVTIPGSVESIGYAAFSECSALTQVTIPNSVTSIEGEAFEGTALYNNANNWTNNVLYIDNCLIEAKEELSGNYEIAAGTRLIADRAFEGCSALTQVTIPSSVTSIGNSAFRYCWSLTQVTISDGVTSIGNRAFYGCSALRQITIPESVTSIGDYAFCNCSALRQMNIPDGVTSIGETTFGGCSALKQITLPESVTSIGDYAFLQCSALTQITLPESVTSIGNEAFSDCSALAEITVLPTVPPTIRAKTFYKINLQVKVSVPEGSRDAYMADENWKKLLDLSAGEISGTCLYNLTWTFTTADSTLTISGTGDMYNYNPWYEFNQAIKNISIQDGVTSIGEGAFAGCSKLTQVTLPESVTSIGYEAFSECSALTAVYYTGDVAGWCGIMFTGYTSNPLSCAHNLYIGNTLVTKLVIPEGVTEIKDCAFYGCSATQVSIPDGVASIGNSAFWNCSALTQVTIGDSVESIGNSAFSGCSALTQVTIGDGVESIGERAFEGCSALMQVTIPDGVTNIGSQAFAWCSALTQITIGNGVTSIGEGAFAYCSALAQVTIGDGVESIGGSAFSECSALTQVTIPGSVTSIGDYTFSECSALAEMTVLATVPPTITASTFSNINPQVKVSIPEGSRDAYMADENWKWLLDLSAGQLSGTCGDNLTWTFTTADSTLTISGTGDMYSFSYQSWGNFRQGIKNISLQDGVTSIGDHAFSNCSALTQVDIPGSVTSIGSMAFFSCSALTQVNIDSGVESIGNSAFSGCSALTQVTIGNSVESIGYAAFSDCSALTQVTIGNSVESIGYAAFSDCSALTQVTIGSGVTSIGDYTFSECSALAEMTVLATVPPTITENTFRNINPQVKVSIPEGSRDAYMADEDWKWLLDLSAGQLSGTCGDNLIWTFTTADCTLSISGRGEMYDYNYSSDRPWYNFNQGIKNISLPDGMTSIGNYAFSDCSALTQVDIPGSVTNIGSQAFAGCSALTQVDIPGSVTSIGGMAFLRCSALKQVTIGDGVTNIGSSAFYECSALTQVTIGNSVTSIGSYAFNNCSALAEMTVLATVPPTVGADAFYNVSRDIPVYVPAEALEDYQVASVWKEFNLHAMPTALQTPSMPESIRVYGGMLHNPQGLPVSIYDMQGRMVYSGTAATVSQPAGVYVVLCAGASRKVLF